MEQGRGVIHQWRGGQETLGFDTVRGAEGSFSHVPAGDVLALLPIEEPRTRQDGDAEQAEEPLATASPNSADFLPTLTSRPRCATGLVASRWRREPLGDVQGEGLKSGSRIGLLVKIPSGAGRFFWLPYSSVQAIVGKH